MLFCVYVGWSCTGVLGSGSQETRLSLLGNGFKVIGTFRSTYLGALS